jgi:hypothetical protein
VKTLPYQRVFERIRAEFVEMPGMQLTPEQVERLTGVESPTCKTVLDDLVRAGFLCISTNGSYGRLSGPRRAESAHVQRRTAERRAS